MQKSFSTSLSKVSVHSGDDARHDQAVCVGYLTQLCDALQLSENGRCRRVTVWREAVQQGTVPEMD